MRVRALAVGVVGPPQQRGRAGAVPVVERDAIDLKRRVDLAGDIRTRLVGKARVDPVDLGERVVVVVERLHGPCHPAGVHLDEHEMQFGIPLQHAGRRQQAGTTRRHRLRCQKVRDRGARSAVKDHVVARSLVGDDGEPGAGQRLPQRFPARVIPLGGADQRDHGAAESSGGDALDFAYCVGDVPCRYETCTSKTR